MTIFQARECVPASFMRSAMPAEWNLVHFMNFNITMTQCSVT